MYNPKIELAMKTTFFLICLTITFSQQVFSQISYGGGKPLTFNDDGNAFVSSSLKSGLIINNKQLIDIDNELEKRLADSIAIMNGHNKNKFYGKGINVDIDLRKEATVQLMGDTGKLYLYEITSPTAYALQVYFDDYKLPKGCRLFFYDKEMTMFLGGFNHTNNFLNNAFGTEFIKGNTVIIEYYEPNNVKFEPRLHINRISHVFINLRNGPFSWPNPDGKGSDVCNINVACQLGYGWERESRSVALVLGYWSHQTAGYYGFCSGALVNNTSQDGTPYFLTAYHCSTDPEETLLHDVGNWLFLFNHQATSCNDNGSSIDRTVSEAIFGAFVLSKDSPNSPTSDFLLLRLNVDKSTLKKYDAVYAGWERDESKAKNSKFTVGIHHPSGDVKKISKDNHSPVSADYAISKNDHWEVKWDQGITEGGSSGSPLFNSERKIIGQLHGGSSYCATPNAPDWYGKFSESWRIGNFTFYLDPMLTGAKSIGHYNPSGKGEHCYNNEQDGNETGVDCGGDCPPCDWVETDGWGQPQCSNGKKDGDETGVDCGGESCRPCGTAEQCSNCSWDGDETGIDCGGSCKPCTGNCDDDIVLFNGISSLPAKTTAFNTIETSNNVTVRSNQNVKFQAGGKITLKPGFTAEQGSSFHAYIAPCYCHPICPIYAPSAFTPDNNGKNDELVYLVSGFNRFNVKVFDRWKKKVYEGSGIIQDNYASLWDGKVNGESGRYGVYFVEAIFYSDCLNQQVTDEREIHSIYNRTTMLPSNLESENNEDILTFIELEDGIEDVSTLTECEIKIEDINIYPIPAKNKLFIEYSTEIESTVLIYDLNGNIMFKDQIYEPIKTVNISSFTKGVYVLKVMNSEQTFIRKIIKE